MLWNSVAVVVRTRPPAIPLAMITMRKSTHGFPFLSHLSMGLRLAALRTAGAPLLFTNIFPHIQQLNLHSRNILINIWRRMSYSRIYLLTFTRCIHSLPVFWCHTWVEFVVGSRLVRRDFLRGLRFSYVLNKNSISKFQFDQDRGSAWRPADAASSLKIKIPIFSFFRTDDRRVSRGQK